MLMLTIWIIKMPVATYHESKPDFMVYLDHGLFVLDIKVILFKNVHLIETFQMLLALSVPSYPVWICT